MYETLKINVKNNSDEAVRRLIIAVVKQLMAGAGGFIASCAAFQGFAPFGVSLCAAAAPAFIPACVFGCTAGFFYVYGLSVLTLRYIAASSVAGIISYILRRSFRAEFYRYFSAASAFAAVLTTGLVLSLSITLSYEEILIYLTEASASAAGAWFLFRFMSISPVKRKVSQLSGSETAAVLTVFGLVLLALGSFPLSVFSPAVIAGAYAVMVASAFGGEKYGALSGICAGVVLGISHSSSFVTGGIALGGLLAGIYGRRNRLISAIIVIISIALTAFTAEDIQSAVYIICDVGISAVLFIFMPVKMRNFFSSVFSRADNGAYLSGQRQMMKTRLKIASDGMNEVASAVKAIGGIYRRRTIPRKESVCESVCSRVCKKCEKNQLCWNDDKNKTLAEFEKIYELLKRDTGSNDNILQHIPEGCLMPERVLSCVSAGIENYRNSMREAAKTGETVNIVSDQFCSISDVFCDLSDDIDDGDEYDAAMSETVASHINKGMKQSLLSCGVFRGEGDRLYVRLSFDDGWNGDEREICAGVSDITGLEFEKPVIQKLGDGTTVMTMCRKTKYRVECGAGQISPDGGKWCGDTYDSFYDGKGRFFMILSDGMGTGKKAAADSVMCCSLCTSLLRSGFSPDVILRMINSAMLVRSGEESLATLDIAVIDLYDGCVCFYKAGASFSVAMRHLKLLKIEKPSLPVGILRDISFEKIGLELRDSDAFVLMSDGVEGSAVAVWRDILKTAAEYDGDELADKLVKTAYMNSREDSPDDITVMTAALLLNDM